MFIAVLFIMTKRWKQLRWPSNDAQINNMWSVHTMGYYSVIKRSKVLNKLGETRKHHAESLDSIVLNDESWT